MDEGDYTDDYVPTLLNSEPVVLFGLSESEIIVSLGMGIGITIIVCFLVSIFLSLGMFFLVLFFVLTALFTFICIKKIRSSKVGKPRGYMATKFRIALSKKSASYRRSYGLIIKDEPFCIGRSKRFLLERTNDE